MSNYTTIFKREGFSSKRLAICVFGCDKIKKYRDQIIKIQETWGKKALSYGVSVYFFLGEEKDLEGPNIINLPGVKDDYLSASYKQFLGLAYLHKYVQPDYVLCCGTDTYLNIPKLLDYVTQFDPNQNLYIGGHGDTRKINNLDIYFHSGGPGFIITRKSLDLLAPHLSTCMEKWTELCTSCIDLVPACDVAMGYFATTIHSTIITSDSFYHCNHKGEPCHRGQFGYQNIISCHSMSLHDFDEFTTILETNHYFS